MAIPESQLVTWSSQGAIVTSASTYATISASLNDPSAGYKDKDFEVYLQGSYGNDTNIYSESDVDIVICCSSTFFHDLTLLNADQIANFHNLLPNSTYYYTTFKPQVVAALTKTFGSSVRTSHRAIKISGDGNRRDADVIAAFTFRRYFKFNGIADQNYVTGMAFYNSSGTRIVNYPKLHSENLTKKHKATSKNFKPAIRIFKNIRKHMVDKGRLAKGVAPSYFIEGLLYNVPDIYFSGSWQEMTIKILTWLNNTTDRSNFLCANEQYYLLRDNVEECWPTANAKIFIDASIKLWNES